MSLINEHKIEEAREYFLKRLYENDKLSSIAQSHFGNIILDKVLYMDNEQLVVINDLASGLLFHHYYRIKNLRFYFGESNGKLWVEGGINLELEVAKPSELTLKNGVRFEYPKCEVESFNRHLRYVDWHQDCETTVDNLFELVDLVIETMLELIEKGRK